MAPGGLSLSFPTLPEAIVRRGKLRRGTLTAAGVGLEGSLSVGEAERILEAPSAEGHLEVTVEHGRLV